MGRDSDEPDEPCGSPLKVSDVAKRVNKYLLSDILGERWIAKGAQAECVDRIAVLLHQRPDGAPQVTLIEQGLRMAPSHRRGRVVGTRSFQDVLEIFAGRCCCGRGKWRPQSHRWLRMCR